MSSFLWSEFPDTPIENKWRLLKQYRNELLTQSDWTQLPDAVLTQAERTAWQTYREALQVIEFSTPNPDDVIFPVPPIFENALPSAEVIAYRTSRTDLKAEYIATIQTLTDIENASSLTNAQVIAALKYLAGRQKIIFKLMARLL